MLRLRAGLRLETLSLYRRALRAARLCPDGQHRFTYEVYARNSFRESTQEKDARRIGRLHLDAVAQIERMEYFHAVRESKQTGATVDSIVESMKARDEALRYAADEPAEASQSLAARPLAHEAVAASHDDVVARHDVAQPRPSHDVAQPRPSHDAFSHHRPSHEAVVAQLASYSQSRNLGISFAGWDADELRGLAAPDACRDAERLGLCVEQAVRLTAKVRGLLIRSGADDRRRT
ncbi:hypothetical protein M885DRAFT_505745 [Pelagophyceae sp. CCMP2097]|nr:hypothetical protein M885DRAFT_505745 [Pelagophyceae sp. CCMP2097]